MAEREVEAGWPGSSVTESNESGSPGRGGGALQWVTVDGPLGVQQEEALKLARNFFYGGFCLLPWLWFVNCFYFWPVLRQRESDPLIRPYVLWSGVGCLTMTVALLAWSLTFAIGGEDVFGSSWRYFAVYDIADKYSMVQMLS
ncbi:hypothetical protein R1sor_019567 [Riccia sorocarpa]|uniref:Gamma-secretase subunit PEN-2 n=1 Tax=Riccia sorocarpa TaxID=122646 RepID=A0ABD3IGI5_9MARC